MGRKNKQNKKQNTVNLDKSSAQKPEKEIRYDRKGRRKYTLKEKVKNVVDLYDELMKVKKVI